jgi:hypothetical protein
MKTIDLGKSQYSLGELLALAKSESVLIHSATGEDFLLEQADEFDREAAVLGASEKFMSFLKNRAGETADVPITEIEKKRGM